MNQYNKVGPLKTDRFWVDLLAQLARNKKD